MTNHLTDGPPVPLLPRVLQASFRLESGIRLDSTCGFHTVFSNCPTPPDKLTTSLTERASPPVVVENRVIKY